MKFQLIAIIVILCVIMVTVSGCVDLSHRGPYSSKESLTVDIYSNYTGKYTIWIPTLFVKDTSNLASIFSTLKLKSHSKDGALTFIGLNTTDVGDIERIDAQGNITIAGNNNIQEDNCCQGTEAYIHNRWMPMVGYLKRQVTVSTKAQTDPDNNMSSLALHLDIDYTGKSDLCYRHNHFSGDILFNGSWSSVVDNVGRSECA